MAIQKNSQRTKFGFRGNIGKNYKNPNGAEPVNYIFQIIRFHLTFYIRWKQRIRQRVPDISAIVMRLILRTYITHVHI